jgi:uncharacterized protein YjdB
MNWNIFGGDCLTTLPPIPSSPRVPQARISFPLILALALLFLLSACIANPASAEAVEPLNVSVSLNKATVAVGEAVTATWTISGGVAPYSVYYSWRVQSGGSSISKKSGTAASGISSSSFTPTFGETCDIYISVTDADGRNEGAYSNKIPVTGSPTVEPLTASVSLDKTAVAVGAPVIATWTISGGVAPYSVYYSWRVQSGGSSISKKSGTAASGASSSSFTPTFGETCDIYISITDADGRNEGAYSNKIPVYIYATGIELNATAVTLDIGKQTQLIATITPSSGTLKTVSWLSSDESVATVDAIGHVTAVGEGEATITASTVDGSDLSAPCDVTVNPPIPVESVSISGPSGPLAVGAKYRLTTSVLPENATYKGLTWTIDKPGVVTVQDGLVTGVAKGSAVITATAPSGAKADWKVTVSSTASRLRAFAHDPGLTVAYSRWCLYFNVGAQYGTPPYTLDVLVEKDGVQAAKTTLTANGSTDLTFTGILSTAVYTLKVTATDAAGRTDSASCSVNVYVGGGNLNVMTLSEAKPVSALTGLTFQNPNPSIAIGSSLTLSPVVAPSGAPRPGFEWLSSNPAAVTVSDTGVAHGVAEGTSVITAYATDGSGLSASCTVRAINPVSSVALNPASAKLTSVGQTVTLQAIVLPADASDGSVTWSTTSAAVATVSDGVVTAKGDGTAIIIATAKDGTGKSASCTVTVDTSIPVTSISLPESKTLGLYGSVRLTPAILPQNATNKAVTWSTSDASIASIAAQGDGVVIGQHTGTATITAKTANGLTAACKITVQATASRLDAFAYNLAAEISGALALSCTVGAQNGTPPYRLDISLEKNGTSIYTASYTTNDSKRISIPMGAVPAANYTVAVTVTDAEGRIDFSSASAYITAVIGSSTLAKNWDDPPVRYVTALRFNDPVQSIAIGQTTWNNVICSPSDAPYPSLYWTSSNPAAVTVSNQGDIKGVAKGSSVITASTTDGTNLSASCTVTVYPDVASVSLNRTEVNLKQGEKASLTATVLPSDANKDLSWSSSNPTVATVDGGLVTGLRDGVVSITAAASNGKRATCKVTVSNKIESITLPLPEDLPLVKGVYELNLKETLQLTPQTVPANVGANFAYTSSNPKVLSVTRLGLMQGLKAGSSTVTITARNTSTSAALTKTMSFHVIVPASSVRMDPGFTIFKDTSRKLKASVSPSDATYRQLRWSSGNQSVATVDASGNVYGVAPGTADITATAHNDVYFTRQVRVTLPVGSITLSAPVGAIYVGKSVQIKPTVSPTDADDSLKWTPSSTKIATVSQTGLVTGKGAGTVKITAAARDGSKKSGWLTLRIVKPASSISIKKALTLFTNGKATEKLAVTASPAKSGYLSMEWKSDKPSVASVDQYGVVTAHADGTAVITATTDSELGKAATCSVTVLTYPTTISLEPPEDMPLRVKQKLPLAPYVQKLDGSMKALTWKSFNTKLATIDSKGVLSAKKPGRVKIRVTTANGKWSEAWFTIVR